MVEQNIHFLHIGKCAGTQIKSVISQINSNHGSQLIFAHPHRITLGMLPQNAPFFFSIRNPTSRFLSGFYSRKRKGFPRYNIEWTKYEAYAFSVFEHANELAEALFSDGTLGQQAIAAMGSIGHVSQNQLNWFVRFGSFLTVRPPIWIIRQEHFGRDLNNFLIRAHLGDLAPKIILDPKNQHANDYEKVPKLSTKAQENLRQWYIQDVKFYELCETWLASQEANGP